MIEESTDSKKHLSIQSISGVVTGDELVSAVTQFYSTNPTTNVLLDFRNADVTALSNDDIKKLLVLVEQHSSKRFKGKTAFVVKDDISFGLSRMYQNYAEMYELPIANRVFRDFQQAMDWLTETNSFSPQPES